ncbi:DUF4332 domain-containing protein [Vallitalea okinawensis]|uniref:DUF4332 domain-containing protein n=1 Tax=Vallitalea okinawensis TaxID=2078660 RepID=UPI000CFBAC47|nr:DUF4332 domain-containing protein [Vallitalea okinawensis]
MYSIPLDQITIREFEEIMNTVHLLPSQKGILHHMNSNLLKLENKGLSNLLDIQDLLKNKKNYLSVAEAYGIDQEYLIILNQMVNSYKVKTMPLTKLSIFTEGELTKLATKKIKNTKHYYEAFISEKNRVELSESIQIPFESIEYGLRIVDLLRINGVGVDYAKSLYKIGVRSVHDYNVTSSQSILVSINELNKIEGTTKATLGIDCIDYCRRFTEKLDCDIC